MDQTPGLPAELPTDDLSCISLQPENSAKSSLQFSENSSNVVRCMLNERGIIFVKVDCASEDEPLTFTWSRDDIPIGNNDRFQITQTSKAVQLAIEHVQKDDTGHYTLYARTKSGEVLRKDVELIVEDRSVGDDPPVFLRRLGDLSVKVGTRTRLLVEIRSSTEVKVTWYRNDRRVCENDRIRYVHEGTFFCLEVAPVILEDGGQWMCMAENLGGRNSCIALLNVLVPKAYKAPEFIEELRAVLTEQGTVSLECKVIGIPTPVLRWFKDSKEIKAGDVFALTANPDDPTSLGTYTCEAVNCMGRAYSSSKVHVVGRGSREGSLKPADSVQYSAPPPIFTDELKDVKVKIGETTILGCKVVVPPWPKTVSWYNKEGRVDSSEKYRMIEDGLGVYMLEIKPSEYCDEGEWKCVVTNNEGSVGISTCTVDMEIPKNYRKPRFMESLKAVLTEEGLVSFECKVVGFPTPILKWFKDGQELKPGDVYQLTGTNSLGTYCCVARNCMGESSSVAVLTVEDVQNQLNDEERSFLIQRNQPPKFEIGLKSQEAKINEDFLFMVKVKANPDALLTWFRDELPIETNDKYNIKKGEDGVCTLSIQRVEFVDQAEWKCIASNDFGTSVTSCFLKLQIPRHYKKPRFLECLRAVLTEEGAVNLECKVIGVPQPVLKWYKDGVELKPGDIHRIISGQDGTCCLGTYTCEARNCMGIVASSASLLGFEDANKNQNQEGFGEELQRNLSLSTIQEERTSQLYDTPAGDITIEEKGDVSFSFDGKEVSVSLYETPDLTEEEALQIVEMYADQISEHVTEHNVVELPPLRFVKETSQSGNLLMEAVVIDIAPEYFSHEEDMRTEAGMDDISINEITVHQLSSQRDSLPFDKEIGQEFEIDDQGQMSSRGEKRPKSANGQDEFYSLSHSKPSERVPLADDDDTETDLQTFASIQESIHLSSHHTASLKDADGTPADIDKDLPKGGSLSEPVAPKRKKLKKGPDSDSSRTPEGLAVLQDISGEAGDGLKLSRSLEPIRDDRLIRRNLEALVPLVKSLSIVEKNLLAIEGEVVCQSGMMMSANSAENSIGIIKNIIDPIRQLQSKMKVYSGEIPLEHLFETLEEDVKLLHRNLQVIEKCVEMDEGGRTLIQRTSVCIIDCCGDKLVNALEHVKQITTLFSEVRLKNELGFIVDDIQQGIQITQDTIKSQMLIQEASALETTKHFTETIAEFQTATTKIPFEEINFGDLPLEAHAVKIIYDPVVKLQAAIENCGRAEPSDAQQPLQNIPRNMINNLSESIDCLEVEVLKLEKNALRQAGQHSLEQKINIAILDIVTPPLFELRRGLERIIETESTGTVDGSDKTTFDYLTLPLQEIQCGLAQLTQDVQTGQFSPDQGADQIVDSQRLTQSIAQATINFRFNVENLAPRIDEHLHESLINLVDDVSKVVGEILNNPLDKYSLAILENLKSPIDDLNYCLRQTEERSSSGSLRYFVEPLRNLFERASICEDILMLTGQRSNDYKVQSLKSVQKSVRNLERDIELLEAELLHQEILTQSNYAEELEEPQPSSTEALALPDFQRNINRIAITLEELQICIAGIQENIVQQPLLAENLLSKLDKAQSCLSKMKNIAVLSTSREDEIVDNVNLLQNVSRPIRNAVESLQILTQPKDTAHRDNTSVLKSISDSLREIKQCVDSNKDVSRLMAPLSELESCLEEVVNKIAPNSEDSSTMEDVSAIASLAAESLPSVSGPSKQRVNVLLGSLKHSLAEVLQSEVVESVASMLSINQAGSFANAIEKMQSLEQKVAVIQTASLEEEAASLSSMQNIASIQALAERLNEINSCILQIQQEIAVEQTPEEHKIDEFQVIAAIATPLVQVQHSVDIIQNMIMDASEKLLSQHPVSEKLKIIQELQPLVLSIHETKALENVKYMVENEKREELRAILIPLQDIECVLLGQHQLHLSPVESFTSIGMSGLNTLAQPLIILQEAVEKMQKTAFEGYSAFEILRERAEPVYEALQYIEKLNIEVLEQAQEFSTQEDVSALKTLAHSAKESELKNATETRAQTEGPINLQIVINLIDDCVAKTSMSNELPEAASAILTELSSKFDDLKDLLACAGPDGSNDLEVNRTIAKALFQFREVLVHTYDDLADKQDLVDMLSDSLKTIEETLNEISQTIPNVEQLFADEIVASIRRDILELINSSKSVKRLDYLPYLDSMCQSLVSMESELVHLNVASADLLAKNSSPIIRMQVSLMDVFRALNDIYEKAGNTMMKPLLDAQNLLLSVNNFIESSEAEISKAELLQEIELLSKPFKRISELIQTGKFDEIPSDVKVLKSEILDSNVKDAESREEQAMIPEKIEASTNKELESVEGESAILSTATQAPVKDYEIIDREKVDAKLANINVSLSEEEKLQNVDTESSEIVEEKPNEIAGTLTNKKEPDVNEFKSISMPAPETHGDVEITTARSSIDASELAKREQATATRAREKETHENDSIETNELYLTEQKIPIFSSSEDGVNVCDSEKEAISLDKAKDLGSTEKMTGPQDSLNEISNSSLEATKDDENVLKNLTEYKKQGASAKKAFEENTESSKLLGKEAITDPIDNQPQSYKELPNDEQKGSLTEPIMEIEGNSQLEPTNYIELITIKHEEGTLRDEEASKLLLPLEGTVIHTPNEVDTRSEKRFTEVKEVTKEALDVNKVELKTAIENVKLDVRKSQEDSMQLQGTESTLELFALSVKKSSEVERVELENLTPDKADGKSEESFKELKVANEALDADKVKLETAIENVKLDVPESQADSVQLQGTEITLEIAQSLLSVALIEENPSAGSVDKSSEATRPESENLTSYEADKKSEVSLEEQKKVTNEALATGKVELETSLENIKLDISKPQENSVQLQGLESTLETEQSLLSVAVIEEKPSKESIEKSPQAERVESENLTPDKADKKSEGSLEEVKKVANEALDADIVELETREPDVPESQEDSVRLQGTESTLETEQCLLPVAPIEEISSAEYVEKSSEPEGVKSENLTFDKADRESEESIKEMKKLADEAGSEMTCEADNLKVPVKTEEAPLSVETTERKTCDTNIENFIAQPSPLTNIESDPGMKTVNIEGSKQTYSGEECLEADEKPDVPELSCKESDKDHIMNRETDINNSESETMETQARIDGSKEIIAASEKLTQALPTRKKSLEVEMLEDIFKKGEKEIIEHLDKVSTTLLQLVRNIQDTEVPLKLDKLPVAEGSRVLSQLTPILMDLLDVIKRNNHEELWSKIDNIRNLSNDLDEASLIVLEDVAPQLYDLLKLLTKVDKAVVNDIINSLKKETSQQNVEEGLKSVHECFAQLQTLEDCSQEVTDCLRPIHQSIVELKEALTALKESPQADGDQRQAISKSLFKLRECLVHTYDDLSQRPELADSLEQPLRDVENMLEALINSTPDAKKLFAEEMIGKSLGEISKLVAIASAIAQNESTQYWVNVITPFKNLEKSFRDLSDLSEEILEKNSGRMVRLTTCLLEPFRALDDLRGNVPLKLREPIIETQNCLVTLSSFIESADGKIDRISLLQRIESLASPLEKLVAGIAKIMTTPVLSDDEIAKLIEPVEEAKLCLVEIQRKLTIGTEAECELYLAEHGGNIDRLKKQLEKIETKILSKHDLTDLVPAEIATLTNIVPLLTALQGTLGEANASSAGESIDQPHGETIDEATSYISESKLNKTLESFSDDMKEVTPVADISKAEPIVEAKLSKSEDITEVAQPQEESERQLIQEDKLKGDTHIDSQLCDKPQEIEMNFSTSQVSEVGDLQNITELTSQATLKAKEEREEEVMEAQNREEVRKQDQFEVPKMTGMESSGESEVKVEQLNIVAAQHKSQASIEKFDEIIGTDKPKQSENSIATECHTVESSERSLIEVPKDTSSSKTHPESKDLVEKPDEIPFNLAEEVKECKVEPILSAKREKESLKESIAGDKPAIVEKQEQLEKLKALKKDEGDEGKSVKYDVFEKGTDPAKGATSDPSKLQPDFVEKSINSHETTNQILEDNKSEKYEKTKPYEPPEKEKEKSDIGSRTSTPRLYESDDVKQKDELKVPTPEGARTDDTMSQEEEKSSLSAGENKDPEDACKLHEVKVKMNSAIEDTQNLPILTDVSESSSIAKVTDAQTHQLHVDIAQLVESGKRECSSATNDTLKELIVQQDKQKIEESVEASKPNNKSQVDPLISTGIEFSTDKDKTEASIPEDIMQAKQNAHVMAENTDATPRKQPQHAEVDGARIEKDSDDKQDLPRACDIQVESEHLQEETSGEKSSLERNDDQDVTNRKGEEAGTEKRKNLQELKQKSEIDIKQLTEKLIETEGKKEDLTSLQKSSTIFSDVSVTFAETDTSIVLQKGEEKSITDSVTCGDHKAAKNEESKDTKLIEDIKPFPNIHPEAPAMAAGAEISKLLDEGKHEENKNKETLENVSDEVFTSKLQGTEQTSDSITVEEPRETRPMIEKTLPDGNSGKNKQVAEDQLVKRDEARKEQLLSSHAIAFGKAEVGFGEKTDNLWLDAIEEISILEGKVESDRQHGTVIPKQLQVNSHEETSKAIESSEKLIEPTKTEDPAAISKAVSTKTIEILADKSKIEGSMESRETKNDETMPIFLDELNAGGSVEMSSVEPVENNDLKIAMNDARSGPEQICDVSQAEMQTVSKANVDQTSVDKTAKKEDKHLLDAEDKTTDEESSTRKIESKSGPLEPARPDAATKSETKVIDRKEATNITQLEAASSKEATLQQEKSISSLPKDQEVVRKMKQDKIETLEAKRPNTVTDKEYKTIDTMEAAEPNISKETTLQKDKSTSLMGKDEKQVVEVETYHTETVAPARPHSSNRSEYQMDNKTTAQAQLFAVVEGTVEQDKSTCLMTGMEKETADEVKQDNIKTVDEKQHQAMPENNQGKKKDSRKEKIKGENSEMKQSQLVETIIQPEKLAVSNLKAEDEKPKVPLTSKAEESKASTVSNADEVVTKADTTRDVPLEVTSKDITCSIDSKSRKEETSKTGDLKAQELEEHQPTEKDSIDVLSQIKPKNLTEKSKEVIDVDQNPVHITAQSAKEKIEDTKDETDKILHADENEALKSIESEAAKPREKIQSPEKSTVTESSSTIKDKSKEKSPSGKTRRSKKSPKTKAKDIKDSQVDDNNQSLGTETKENYSETTETNQHDNVVEVDLKKGGSFDSKVNSANELQSKAEIISDIQAKNKDVDSKKIVLDKAEEGSSGGAKESVIEKVIVAPNQSDKFQHSDEFQEKIGSDAGVDKPEMQPRKSKEKRRKKSYETSNESKNKSNVDPVLENQTLELPSYKASMDKSNVSSPTNETGRAASIEAKDGGDELGNEKLLKSIEKPLEKDEDSTNVITNVQEKDIVADNVDKGASLSTDDLKISEKIQTQIESESKLDKVDDESSKANETTGKKNPDERVDVENKSKEVSANEKSGLDSSLTASDTEKSNEKLENKTGKEIIQKEPVAPKDVGTEQVRMDPRATESFEESLTNVGISETEEKNNEQTKAQLVDKESQAASEKTDDSVSKRSSKSRKKSKDSNVTLKTKSSIPQEEGKMPSNGTEIAVENPTEEKGKAGRKKKSQGNIAEPVLEADLVKVENIQNKLLEEEKLSHTENAKAKASFDLEEKKPLDSDQSFPKPTGAEKTQCDTEGAHNRKPKKDELHSQPTEIKKKGVEDGNAKNEQQLAAEMETSRKTERTQTTRKHGEAKLKVSDDSTKNVDSLTNAENLNSDQLSNYSTKVESLPTATTTDEEKSFLFEGDTSQSEKSQPGVKLKKTGRSQGVVFNVCLTSQTISVGNAAKLICNALGQNITAKWYRNGEEIIGSSQKYFPQNKDGLITLEIRDVEQSDAAEYKCVVTSNGDSSETKCQLSVFNPAELEVSEVKPIFTRCIRDTYYLNEDELVLDCRIRGNPRPEISWMKDTDMITNDNKYQQLDQADGYCKLIIREPTEKDSGTYICRADNGVGSDKMAHVVDFKGRERFILEKAHGFFHRDPNKPHLTNILGDHIVTAGGTVAIQAEFGQTSSPIEVQWLKDKSTLPAADNIRTFVDHGVYTLAIEKATTEMAGTYTCRASNAFGRLESNANVHIVAPVMKGGKPALFLSRPETEMKIAVHDPFSISFRVQGDPKPKLTLLKGTKDITKSDRVSKEAQEDYIRFTVHNSMISDSGTYFVVARNQHGTDRLFVTVTVKVPKK